MPTHDPFTHRSIVVQTSPSLQSALLSTCTQPIPGSQLSLVHTFPSLQSSGGPGVQAPLLHRSLTVQALPSLHTFVLFTCVQPVAGLQPSVVQPLPSSQLTAAPGTHCPPLHVSLWVQALPSSQGSVLFVCVQPLAGLQPSVVHTLPSLQPAAGPGLQAPPAHASPVVQALPSSHDALLLTWTHPVAGLQLSSVQGLPSLQLTGSLTQAWATHRSFVVQ